MNVDWWTTCRHTGRLSKDRNTRNELDDASGLRVKPFRGDRRCGRVLHVIGSFPLLPAPHPLWAEPFSSDVEGFSSIWVDCLREMAMLRDVWRDSGDSRDVFSWASHRGRHLLESTDVDRFYGVDSERRDSSASLKRFGLLIGAKFIRPANECREWQRIWKRIFPFVPAFHHEFFLLLSFIRSSLYDRLFLAADPDESNSESRVILAFCFCLLLSFDLVGLIRLSLSWFLSSALFGVSLRAIGIKVALSVLESPLPSDPTVVDQLIDSTRWLINRIQSNPQDPRRPFSRYSERILEMLEPGSRNLKHWRPSSNHHQ